MKYDFTSGRHSYLIHPQVTTQQFKSPTLNEIWFYKWKTFISYTPPRHDPTI